ncbi:MAG TPA: hypothetical protein VFS20_16280 [Longimicrobium sp.]|nr:hypothetical protein [Longimicrobium sp.]
MSRDEETTYLIGLVRRRAEQTSVRHVAGELAMSHGGVQNLIRGNARPYGKTMAKLRRWLLAQSAGEAGMSAAAAHYLIPEMLSLIPGERHDRACLEFVGELESLFRRYDTAPPEWLVDVRERMGTTGARPEPTRRSRRGGGAKA